MWDRVRSKLCGIGCVIVSEVGRVKSCQQWVVCAIVSEGGFCKKGGTTGPTEQRTRTRLLHPMPQTIPRNPASGIACVPYVVEALVLKRGAETSMVLTKNTEAWC